MLRSASSWLRQSSYADSNKPGPNNLWTSIAAPTIARVSSVSFIKVFLAQSTQRSQRRKARVRRCRLLLARGVTGFAQRGGTDDRSGDFGLIHQGLLNTECTEVKEKNSSNGDFFVGAEDVAHGVADFTQSGVGFD